MAEVQMTIVQKLKSITVPILINILLPMFDVFSDARLIILLFLGGLICKQSFYDDYWTCSWRRGPTNYCTDPNTNHDVCEKTTSGFSCKNLYEDCQKDPTNYCTNPTTNHAVCGIETNPKFGLMLLVPFLLNYIVSFITWWRNDKNKKISFIFALLNLYAPYGKFVLGGSCNLFVHLF